MPANHQYFDETLGVWIVGIDIDAYLDSFPNSVLAEKARHVQAGEEAEEVSFTTSAPPDASMAAMSAIALGSFLGYVPIADAEPLVTNMFAGSRFQFALTANRTLNTPTNANNGQVCEWRIHQDGTGGHTLTLHSDFRFGDDIASLSLPTDANTTCYMTAVYHEIDGKWDVIDVKRGYGG